MAVSLSQRASDSLVVPATAPFISALQDILKGERVFVAHDAKLQIRRLHAAGWPVPRAFADTMIMSYVINPGLPSHTLGNVARDRLKQDVAVRKDVAKTAPLFALDHEIGSSPLTPYLQYLGEKSDIAMALRDMLEPELHRDPALLDIYNRIEMPLSPVLARMEERGIRIDVPLLAEMSATMVSGYTPPRARVIASASMSVANT
jgi:DNA polymerase-1